MNLRPPEFSLVKKSMSIKALLLFAIVLAAIVAAPIATKAQQASAPGQKPFVEEWVYRVQYGHKDEWWQIFKKYQIAILERQKQLGYVKDFTVWAPGLHTDESSRWDYRVVIVRASYDAPPGQSEEDVAKHIFPDQAQFKHDEDRRWELTANHWDLPIHQVKLEGAD